MFQLCKQPAIELWMFCDFILGLNFISLLFLDMVLYANEFKTKGNKS